MIYAIPILLCTLPKHIGTIVQGRLQPVDFVYCAERSVYASRYWNAVQAGSQIDYLVEIPLHRCVEAGDFARFRGRICEIVQAQFEQDQDGLPVTVLSLRRTEGNYDISSPS